MIDDYRKKNRQFRGTQVGLDSIKELADVNESFEFDDEQLKLMTLARDFRYLHRLWMERSYDYSLREIAEMGGVNYGEVYRVLREMREHILKEDINEYDRKVKKLSEAGKISIRPKDKKL